MSSRSSQANGVPQLQAQAYLPPGAASKALLKGTILRFKKEIPQATEVMEKALRLFEQEGQLLGSVLAKLELAWLYGALQQRAASEQMFRETESLINTHADITGMNEVQARWLHYKGLLAYQAQQYGEGLKFFKQALNYCDPGGLEAAKIYDSLGVHYERTGDVHRAIRYLKSALGIKTQFKEPVHEEAVTCQILGRLHLLYEDYELAQQYLKRSLQICADLKDEKRKAALNNELIRLFLRCGKVDEAYTLIQETKQECQHRQLRIQGAVAGFYEVYLLYLHRQFNDAQSMLQKEILPVFQRFNYKRGLAMSKRLQAWLAFSLDPQNTAKCVALIGEAIELFRFENMIDEVAKSHFELGKLYTELGKQKLAFTSFLDALKITEENGLFYLTAYIEDEIFRTHEEQWKEIVNKRTRHERLFEKRNSLVDALTELMQQAPYPAETEATSNEKGMPFLLSLLRVGQAVAAERDLNKLLDIMKDETERALDAEHCTVFLYDATENRLWSRYTNTHLEVETLEIPAHEGLAGYVVKTGEWINIQHVGDDPRFNPEVDQMNGHEVRHMLCLPMRNRKGDVIGVFQVINKRKGLFNRSDEELLAAIAANAGNVVENAQLYQEQKISFESFISTLSSTIDARDPITAGHSERVMEYALLIGDKMNLPLDEMDVLKYAALLHDIGKIGVKEEILIKEGRLTVNEYKHIQQHVYYTHEILKNIHFDKHLASVPEVAASHHEKVDGSGYFRGIKGDNINLGGRILAVADVFDAITSRRQYRNRMPFDRVIKILREESGSHFDGAIIDTFLEIPLRELGRVLCLDKHLPVPTQEVQRVLSTLPQKLLIRDYLALMNKDKPTAQEAKWIQQFEHLYHFSEISDLD